MDLSAVDPLVWIILAVVVVVAIVVLAIVMTKKRKRREETRKHLRDRFGAEYDRTVGAARSRKEAEQELLAREQRRASFSIRPVPADLRDDFQARWDAIQADFVDAPHASLRHADELLDEIAVSRGYPDAAREQRLADLSVDHPAAVERYRSTRVEDGNELTTEQLRSALLASRDLFETMLNRGEFGSADTPPTPFQELVVEDEAGETSARGDVHDAEDGPPMGAHTGEDGPIDLTPHEPREEVGTGGMPVLGPDGQPLPPPPADEPR
ncbi:MAG TPA: hypothetical protein VK906_16020 [Egicoccus sp.]|nr:hypothetical protein [Egicoccus sp.]HSK24693.1 hypothetical protein [Egicoccus sp.]